MVGTWVGLWVADFVVADRVDSEFGYCSRKSWDGYKCLSMGYLAV